jgi:Amt family ammonium transporter
MESQIFELQYAIDTFYFLVCGALVMWMAAGFSLFESGLVRAKNTVEILTNNVALYAVACIMYLAGAAAALAGVLLLGPRRGKYDAHGQVVAIPGVNLPLVPLTNGDASFTGQLAGIATIFASVFGASLATWAVLKATMGIRVDAEEEYEGLDIGECGMEAYPEFTSSS